MIRNFNNNKKEFNLRFKYHKIAAKITDKLSNLLQESYEKGIIPDIEISFILNSNIPNIRVFFIRDEDAIQKT